MSKILKERSERPLNKVINLPGIIGILTKASKLISSETEKMSRKVDIPGAPTTLNTTGKTVKAPLN